MDLKEFFQENPKAALGFSGGVDSAYLLWAAKEYGAQVQPYFIKTAFQPAFEEEDARRLCAELEVALQVIPVDILASRQVGANPPDRCYWCKRELFSALCAQAEKDGYRLILDGTNASDDAGDRPGMRALAELSVRSPLRECGLTKNEIRKRSKEAGLFTWDKPAYACLATRIPTGRPLLPNELHMVESAEDFLSRLGCRDFRVRLRGEAALIQVPPEQMGLVVEHRKQILEKLRGLGFKDAALDLQSR